MKRQFYVDCYNDSVSVTARDKDDFYIPPHETKSSIKGYFMRWIPVTERLPEAYEG